MEEPKEIEEWKPEKTQGAFLVSLVRNNKRIREDRARAIGEDTQLLYKRMIEDLRVKIRRLERERENMLDLSPSNSMSLIVASDFKADEFVAKDVELGVTIRNESIKLEIAEKRYFYLFGEGA